MKHKEACNRDHINKKGDCLRLQIFSGQLIPNSATAID